MITRKILSFAFCGITLSLFATAKAQEKKAETLVTAVKPYVDRQELAGAVMLVANRSGVLATQSVGWADIETDAKMTEERIFWIASQSKPITAAALMMLVDEGKLKLDDPVEKYLPEFHGLMFTAEKSDTQKTLKKPVRPITVRDTLSHTSGMPFKSAIEEPTLDAWPLFLRVKSYAMTPLDFQPGSKYQYSNAGINTAARIIEVITGKPFETFLDERLFQPLGMKDATFWPTEAQAARVPTAYKPGPNKNGLVAIKVDQLHYPLIDRKNRFPMPAGGLFATAHDLARFYRMLLNDGELDGRRYLTKESVGELTRKQTPETLKDNYGLGFAIAGTGVFGHGGAYSTNSTADRNRDLILIWLVQHAGFPGEGEKAQGRFREAATKTFSK